MAALALAGAIAALGGMITVRAQAPLTIQMTPTAGREPGLSGTTTITPVGTNQIRVDIRVTGLPPNQSRAAHIHSPGPNTSDPCDTGGPVVYPLTDVRSDGSGVGTSTTTVTLDSAKGIPTRGWYVNVHERSSADGAGNGVICGLITTSLGTTAAGATPAAGGGVPASGPGAQGGAATNLPATGDNVPAAKLLLAIAATGAALMGAGLLVRSRRA
jgi:hypothetical protein